MVITSGCFIHQLQELIMFSHSADGGVEEGDVREGRKREGGGGTGGGGERGE